MCKEGLGECVGSDFVIVLIIFVVMVIRNCNQLQLGIHLLVMYL